MPYSVLSKDGVSNQRGEGIVAGEPGDGSEERRTQPLSRVQDRVRGRAFGGCENNRAVWIPGGHKESGQMEEGLAVL